MDHIKLTARVRNAEGEEWDASTVTYERDSEVTPKSEHELTYYMLCTRSNVTPVSPLKVEYISGEEYDQFLAERQCQ